MIFRVSVLCGESKDREEPEHIHFTLNLEMFQYSVASRKIEKSITLTIPQSDGWVSVLCGESKDREGISTIVLPYRECHVSVLCGESKDREVIALFGLILDMIEFQYSVASRKIEKLVLPECHGSHGRVSVLCGESKDREESDEREREKWSIEFQYSVASRKIEKS